MSHLMSSTINSVLNITGNTTVSIPAGYSILQIVVENTTGNAVTGGIRIGTTAGGVDVVTAIAVSANALFVITDTVLLKSIFSLSTDTTLYIETVTLWNSANLNIRFVLRKIN